MGDSMAVTKTELLRRRLVRKHMVRMVKRSRYELREVEFILTGSGINPNPPYR